MLQTPAEVPPSGTPYTVCALCSLSVLLGYIRAHSSLAAWSPPNKLISLKGIQWKDWRPKDTQEVLSLLHSYLCPFYYCICLRKKDTLLPTLPPIFFFFFFTTCFFLIYCKIKILKNYYHHCEFIGSWNYDSRYDMWSSHDFAHDV